MPRMQTMLQASQAHVDFSPQELETSTQERAQLSKDCGLATDFCVTQEAMQISGISM